MPCTSIGNNMEILSQKVWMGYGYYQAMDTPIHGHITGSKRKIVVTIIPVEPLTLCLGLDSGCISDG
ncbi:MAG: hypothetical protein F7C08_00695 [Desulfurococcales archaeon]|nr:hypothetical protein [Desulfurococcales archaeon]MCE4605041.1 hypothetical protein [Desulfurococcales archaeon]